MFRSALPSLLTLCLMTLTTALAAGTPAGTVITNTAVFDSEDGRVISNPASLTVEAVCAPNLTPTGLNATALGGQPVTFAHTLTNVGNSAQTFTLGTTPGNAFAYQDRNADGVATADERVSTVTLAADAAVPLLLFGLTGTHSESWTLSASCANPLEGAQTVTDTVSTSVSLLELQKSLLTEDVTVAGAEAKYAITVRNPNLLAVQNVVVTDLLPTGETLVSAAPEATSQDAGGLRWALGTLQPGEARQIVLTVRLGETLADDTLVTNTASASSSDLQSPTSSQAALRIFSTRLLLQKAVLERVADVGDLLHYTVTVTNPSKANLSVSVIDDTPSAGLRYVAGSTTLDGTRAADPTISGPHLHFQTGPLNAGASHVVTYTLQVTPEAGDDLDNTAAATALGANSVIAARVVSNLGRVQVERRIRLFGGQAEIIGRVYVDRAHAGHYVAGIDTPVAGARILLAGGLEVLTDQEGRYHFADLTPGTYALRLDPKSTPWKALPWIGDRGLTGSRTVDLLGLTTVDFPLQPNTGSLK